jgi:hypothetical protein
MTFNAKEYAWAIAHWKRTEKPEPPVTLADHEAAEREARKLIETRLRDGCENDTIFPRFRSSITLNTSKTRFVRSAIGPGTSIKKPRDGQKSPKICATSS